MNRPFYLVALEVTEVACFIKKHGNDNVTRVTNNKFSSVCVLCSDTIRMCASVRIQDDKSVNSSYLKEGDLTHLYRRTFGKDSAT